MIAIQAARPHRAVMLAGIAGTLRTELRCKWQSVNPVWTAVLLPRSSATNQLWKMWSRLLTVQRIYLWRNSHSEPRVSTWEMHVWDELGLTLPGILYHCMLATASCLAVRFLLVTGKTRTIASPSGQAGSSCYLSSFLYAPLSSRLLGRTR